MTSRELELYARRVLEQLLTDAIAAISRLDKLDQAIDRSCARMKVYAAERRQYVANAPRLMVLQDRTTAAE